MIYLCPHCGAWMPGTIIGLAEMFADGLQAMAREIAQAQGKEPPAPTLSAPNCWGCQQPMRLVTSSQRLMLRPTVVEHQEGHQE